ncbi:tRNA (adenosine(37)-N6)-dimethylallyltransferase MiaA [Desulfuribacillus stibiiarsenatis]|nr:tRNA (adenosine(37)-N6)-dimethylallyltransferase MiaA [Desulfuribacillus stibiiarsenatis]
MDNLLVIIGPTAVGKSKLGVEIARKHYGEIISGDSMQVYKECNIGTAKVSIDEMQGIPHHLIDVIDPREDFSVARFKEMVPPIISDIHKRGKLPCLVGGTGLYVQSLIDDYGFTDVQRSDIYRGELELVMQEKGERVLFEMLQVQDPESAIKIHPNDTKRIMRALEVYHLTDGKKLSSLAHKKESPYNLLYIGLNMERSKLYQIINQRVDIMIQKGLVEEVRFLLNNGISETSNAMQGIGYKEIIPYIKGEIGLEECVETLKMNTRRFAKRQLTWFRRDPRIQWFHVDEMDWSTIVEKIDVLIAGKFN